MPNEHQYLQDFRAFGDEYGNSLLTLPSYSNPKIFRVIHSPNY